MSSLAIVGCGSAKLSADEIDGAVELRNLYTSNYFRKKRKYAEIVTDGWVILSAKHGLASPSGTVTKPYDLSIGDLDDHSAHEWSLEVRHDLRRHLENLQIDEVHLLVGQQYELAIEDILEEQLPHGWNDVVRPFAGTGGIGEQMAVLTEAIERARGPDQSTLFPGGPP